MEGYPPCIAAILGCLFSSPLQHSCTFYYDYSDVEMRPCYFVFKGINIYNVKHLGLKTN